LYLINSDAAVGVKIAIYVEVGIAEKENSGN